MLKDEEGIKDWRSTGRKRARAVLTRLTKTGERDYKCDGCGLVPDQGVEVSDRSTGLDANHINKNWKDNDPANLEWLCRTCHYKKDRATAAGVSSVEDEYGYGV